MTEPESRFQQAAARTEGRRAAFLRIGLKLSAACVPGAPNAVQVQMTCGGSHVYVPREGLVDMGHDARRPVWFRVEVCACGDWRAVRVGSEQRSAPAPRPTY
jgi:hypothetical protein